MWLKTTLESINILLYMSSTSNSITFIFIGKKQKIVKNKRVQIWLHSVKPGWFCFQVQDTHHAREGVLTSDMNTNGERQMAIT